MEKALVKEKYGNLLNCNLHNFSDIVHIITTQLMKHFIRNLRTEIFQNPGMDDILTYISRINELNNQSCLDLNEYTFHCDSRCSNEFQRF